MLAHPAIALLAAESAASEGPTPDRLANPLGEMPTFAIARDAFLLHLPSGLRFHYQQGRGVTYSRPDGVPDLDVSLFLNGSVYGAIAWINGFVPLHASAVVHQGQAYAFTGHSGAGKSTLAAALGTRDFPLLADDVLVLDLSQPDAITCLPGHKQLKLWGDALGLTGLPSTGPVRHDLNKFYTAPAGGYHAEPMPLAQLYFLSDNAREQAQFTAVTGMAKLAHARSAFYRPRFCAALLAQVDLFTLLAQICGHTAMTRFDRPRRKEIFADGVTAMAAAIRQA